MYDEWDVDAAMAENISLDEIVQRKEDALRFAPQPSRDGMGFCLTCGSRFVDCGH